MTQRLQVATRQGRLIEMMTSALGGSIGALLGRDGVEEVRVNPDGKLWFVEYGQRHDAGHHLSEPERMRVIQIVADHVGEIVNARNPSFPAELPETGFRFQATIPPQSPDGPQFVIRKKSSARYTLADYVARGQMTEAQKAVIENACRDHDNILIAGGTATGKTTFANAVLREMAKNTGRFITMEDTLELEVEADEVVRLRTVRHGAETQRTMQQLLRDTLRLTPERLIVGEVRGPEVMDMLDAWNTGHPGGLATIHANSAGDALQRIEDLLIQGGFTPVPRKIARAIQLIVSIGFVNIDTGSGQRAERQLREVLRVAGVRSTDTGYEYQFIKAV
jgi:P-type conjugative transfer ATPase TrbB